MNHLADLRRHRFLVLAVVLGPVGGSALIIASHLSSLQLPQLSDDCATLVSLLLLAPVLEELVFRGGIQDALDRTALGRPGLPGGVSVGNLLTSAIFAAAHLLVSPPWLAASIFVPSVVFGHLKQLYPSLLPAMLVHAWYNLCYLTAGSRV